jgi:8-oxo-dGTP pyrophosphatase MutT (NUDIX family)
MAGSMKIENGAFTAAGFARRATKRALPLSAAAGLGHGGTPARGDHDLNPDLAGVPLPPGGLKPAAVLIGVIDREPGATVILTLRAASLNSHAGQIAFPGGRVDERDANFVETALREAHEEIALPPERVTPLGLLEPYRTRTGYRVVPVLSLVSEDIAPMADDREVAEVFEVPLEFLMTADNHQRHSREWQGVRRHFYAMPYGDRYIWGATAGILRAMYERLYTE